MSSPGNIYTSTRARLRPRTGVSVTPAPQQHAAPNELAAATPSSSATAQDPLEAPEGTEYHKFVRQTCPLPFNKGPAAAPVAERVPAA